MNLFKLLFLMVPTILAKECSNNRCITFVVTEGTSCDFMCNYCAETLGTNDFIFTDWVCDNRNGRCKGEPIAWMDYTCCSCD